MQEMDCVEVIVEKECYAAEGVHKGMQGWVCCPPSVPNYVLVNFPRYGEKEDIAEIAMRVEDLIPLPDGMNAQINETIEAQWKHV